MGYHAPMIIDTLKLKTKLEHAGMDDQTAVAIADALGNADFDQLATKTDLKIEIDTLRADIQAQIAAVKADLRTEIAAVRTDLQTEIAAVRTDITTLKADIQTQIATVKTDIYKALWIQWGATVGAVAAIVAAIVTISKLF